MFFDYHIAKFVWNQLYFTFGINPPRSVNHMLGSWLSGFSAQLRKMMLVGASALCWSVWLCRNEVVFQKVYPNSYMQVLYRGIYWARFWSQLSKEEAMNQIKRSCQQLEGVILELLAKKGWNFRNRIDL